MPDPSPDLSEAIADLAVAPKKSTGDNGSLEEHGIQDLIEADKYLAKKRVSLGLGFRVSRIRPGGAP
jgi:hypothetical protein